MNLYIYENQHARDLDPISLTRPVFDLRTGESSFLERIMRKFPGEAISLFVREEMEELCRESYPDTVVNPNLVEDGVWLLGNVLWQGEDLDKIINGSFGFYYHDKILIGAKIPKETGNGWLKLGGPVFSDLTACFPTGELQSVPCRFLWTILEHLPQSLLAASQLLHRNDTPKPTGYHVINPEKVIISEETVIQPGVVLDASQGPIIIEKSVKIYGNSILEGPLFIGEHTLVKPLTQIKNSAIGPQCKVGGELNTVILQSYTNKVHEGHLGDAYLGSWVNLGAGTINSNLKNNYAPVKVQVNKRSVETRNIHIGCFLGDHVKTAIGTKLNTGTIVGPGAMVVSEGFPPKTIRPFTWFVGGKHRRVLWEKFIETAKIVNERRRTQLTTAEINVLRTVYNDR